MLVLLLMLVQPSKWVQKMQLNGDYEILPEIFFLDPKLMKYIPGRKIEQEYDTSTTMPLPLSDTISAGFSATIAAGAAIGNGAEALGNALDATR